MALELVRDRLKLLLCKQSRVEVNAMAEVDQNDVLRIVLRQTLNAASAVENVFHLKCGIAGGTTNGYFWVGAVTFVKPLIARTTEFKGIGFTYDDIYCF